jgi:hypothetical protein
LPAVIDPAKYVVVGRGRWAPRIKAILSGEGRGIASLEESRRAISEDESAYHDRLLSSFRGSGAQIAWLCVPPGSHIPVMIEAAIEAGLHVVSEKPWLCGPQETHRLETLAKTSRALLAIHYEYCLMDAVEAWRREWNGGTGLSFGGHLKVQRPNHIGLPALDNLGCHLFSIHEYCVPNSSIAEIGCDYDQPDDRRVWLEKQGERISEIDLLANKQPIIQRFIARVEAATCGAEFPFDLQFALRVAERTVLWRQQVLHRSER